MSTIIYGPQGCGKTKNKNAIAKHLGLKNIIDDWRPGQELPQGTLALTNATGLEVAVSRQVPIQNTMCFYHLMSRIQLEKDKHLSRDITDHLKSMIPKKYESESACALEVYEVMKQQIFKSEIKAKNKYAFVSALTGAYLGAVLQLLTPEQRKALANEIVPAIESFGAQQINQGEKIH